MASKANVEDPRWFIHNAGGEDGTFCFDCAEKRRQELRTEFKDDPETLRLLERIDGGYGSIESESCLHCETCGVLLNYTLTDYGAESEWDHFREHGILLSSPIEAYHILAILENRLKLVGISKTKIRGKAPR